MSTVQQTFNTVIAHDYYGDLDYSGSNYMCNALKAACRDGVICYSDFRQARAAINEYILELDPHGDAAGTTLSYCLQVSSLPCNFSDRLAIYKDWENRPRRKS